VSSILAGSANISSRFVAGTPTPSLFQKIPKKLIPIWQVRAVTVLDKIGWMERIENERGEGGLERWN
jgi:hypothetical protein